MTTSRHPLAKPHGRTGDVFTADQRHEEAANITCCSVRADTISRRTGLHSESMRMRRRKEDVLPICARSTALALHFLRSYGYQWLGCRTVKGLLQVCGIRRAIQAGRQGGITRAVLTLRWSNMASPGATSAREGNSALGMFTVVQTHQQQCVQALVMMHLVPTECVSRARHGRHRRPW